MKIYIIASEVAPYAKAGGLGDVIGALPQALARHENDCRVVMPLYGCIPEQYKNEMQYITNITVRVDWRDQYCGIFYIEKEGVTYYFIDNLFYFGGNSIYTDSDLERFAFFQKAALEILQTVDFTPDIIHCNDWQTGMVPILLDAYYKNCPIYENAKTVLTIHNLMYQGRFNKKDTMDMFSLDPYYFTPDKAEYYKDANFLKAGIVYANYITTVSPTYSEEIKTLTFGEGLEGLLYSRSQSLQGVLNGIDYEKYSPNKNKVIDIAYNRVNFRNGKKLNKLALQEKLGLPIDENIPMIAVISRLTGQKGIDLIIDGLGAILSKNIQFVLLGTGDKKYEDEFRRVAWENPQKMSANITFDDALAQQIYAASDIFLMPSLFEPCGLSQLMAMSFGSLPLVREVGGLYDTVTPYNQFTGEGTGFSFGPYCTHDMLFTLEHALELYENKQQWNKVVKAAMSCHFSWDVAAEKYIEIYNMLI